MEKQDELDLVTNEIIHGFMEHGGREACRYLLGKLLAEIEQTTGKLDQLCRPAVPPEVRT